MGLARLIKFTKKHWVVFLLAALTIIYEIYYQMNFVTGRESFNILGPADEMFILRYIPVTILAYLIIFKNTNHYKNLAILSKVSIPVLFMLFIASFVTSPQRINSLTREDGLIENLSAGFLFLASAIMLISFFKFHSSNKSKKINTAKWLFLALTAVFFILGMEEISWMQRILNIESSGYFLEYNWQQETNIHNFNSTITNDLYYLGAFILLVLAPFYSQTIKRLTRKIANAEKFIPSTWLIAPFILMSGLANSSIYASTLIRPALFVISAVILAYIVLHHLNRNEKAATFNTILSLSMLIIAYFITLLYDYAPLGMRPNAAGEFRELLIAIGVLVYSISVYVKFFHPKLSKAVDKQPIYH